MEKNRGFIAGVLSSTQLIGTVPGGIELTNASKSGLEFDVELESSDVEEELATYRLRIFFAFS